MRVQILHEIVYIHFIVQMMIAIPRLVHIWFDKDRCVYV